MTKSAATLSTLWQRAPLWSFSLLSAISFSGLFLLFPPISLQPIKSLTPVAQTANYKSAPMPPMAEEIKSSVTSPQIQERAATTSAESAQKIAEQNSEQSHTPDATHTSDNVAGESAESKPAEPKSAGLALATPSNNLSESVKGAITYRDSFSINGFQLPLPPGDWISLASINGSIPNSYGSHYILGKVENGRLVAAVIALAFKSNLKPGSGYELFSGCKAPAAIFVVNEGATANDHQACWLMSNYFTPPWRQWRDREIKMDNMVRAAAGELEAKGITYPQDFVAVLFYRAETWGMIKVSYLFNPETEGLTSSAASVIRDSDWTVLNLHKFPDKVAYASKIKNWGSEFWSRVKVAFAAGE